MLNFKRLRDDVVAYSESGWSKIGKLKTINFQMTPIRVGKDIFIFGGDGDMMTQDKHTEIWRVSTLFSTGYTIWVILYDSYCMSTIFWILSSLDFVTHRKRIKFNFSINGTNQYLEHSKYTTLSQSWATGICLLLSLFNKKKKYKIQLCNKRPQLNKYALITLLAVEIWKAPLGMRWEQINSVGIIYIINQRSVDSF